MLTAHLRYWRSRLCLLQNSHNLAIAESRRLHVELPHLIREILLLNAAICGEITAALSGSPPAT
jgi:hypothetical protein